MLLFVHQFPVSQTPIPQLYTRRPCCTHLVAHFLGRSKLLHLWELSCAGFRHSAGFHVRVILDGTACPLGEPGEVDDDVLCVLGVDRVVPIVVRVLVQW